MKPTEFKEQTKILNPPHDMTDIECGTLPIYSNEGVCVSCWKMSFKERMRGLMFGKVWVWVRSGKTQPPIALECDRTVFVKSAGK